LSSSAIRGEAQLEIWSGGAIQDYDLLRVYGCPSYFRVKECKLDPRGKEFVFFCVKRNLKDYKLYDSKNKKFVLSRYVTSDEPSMLRPNSQ